MWLTFMPIWLRSHSPFSLLSSGQLVRLTTCCLGVFLQNLIKVSLHFRQNKNNEKNPFILKGYRRHPKTKQQQKTPYTISQIEAVEHRWIQLFIVISGITSVGSAAPYTLLRVRLRSRSQPSNSQEHVNKTCLIFLGESASQHRYSIPGCHTKLSVSVDTYNRVETTPERHLPL